MNPRPPIRRAPWAAAQADEHQKVQSLDGAWQAFIVTRQEPKTCPSQPKLRSTTQRRGSSTKLRSASGCLITCSRMPHVCAAFGCGIAGIALIHKGQLLHVLAGHRLHASASTPTCARSCSLAAVTCSANNCPSVSTAMCTLLPRRRLAPS